MKYEKPKVTIDLEEYNELIQTRDSKLDIDDVCNTLGIIILQSMRQSNGAMNLQSTSEMATTHKDFEFNIRYNQLDYHNPIQIKVIQKTKKIKL